MRQHNVPHGHTVATRGCGMGAPGAQEAGEGLAPLSPGVSAPGGVPGGQRRGNAPFQQRPALGVSPGVPSTGGSLQGGTLTSIPSPLVTSDSWGPPARPPALTPGSSGPSARSAKGRDSRQPRPGAARPRSFPGPATLRILARQSPTPSPACLPQRRSVHQQRPLPRELREPAGPGDPQGRASPDGISPVPPSPAAPIPAGGSGQAPASQTLPRTCHFTEPGAGDTELAQLLARLFSSSCAEVAKPSGVFQSQNCTPGTPELGSHLGCGPRASQLPHTLQLLRGALGTTAELGVKPL